MAAGSNTRQNVRMLLRFMLILTAMVVSYSVIFHFLMAWEGKEYSWITGVYWTLTVMSTLGFGDITFTHDIGRVFSIVVLLSGVVFMLVLLPFAFIKFLFAPWMEAEARRRTPRELPVNTLTSHLDGLRRCAPLDRAIYPPPYNAITWWSWKT